jgi:hypothetical protein
MRSKTTYLGGFFNFRSHVCDFQLWSTQQCSIKVHEHTEAGTERFSVDIPSSPRTKANGTVYPVSRLTAQEVSIDIEVKNNSPVFDS